MPATVPLPETAVTDRLREWQWKHTGPGGWSSALQSSHRRERSMPSAPEVQQNALLLVPRGNGPTLSLAVEVNIAIHARWRVGVAELRGGRQRRCPLEW